MWSVFPNPVKHDRIAVDLPAFEGVATMVLHDLSGREALRVGNVRQGRQEVSVAGLAPGVYSVVLLHATGAQEVLGTGKLVRM